MAYEANSDKQEFTVHAVGVEIVPQIGGLLASVLIEPGIIAAYTETEAFDEVVEQMREALFGKNDDSGIPRNGAEVCLNSDEATFIEFSSIADPPFLDKDEIGRLIAVRIGDILNHSEVGGVLGEIRGIPLFADLDDE